MDHDIESIADIANLLKDRDRHGSIISDSESGVQRPYQNILDSKIFSDKDYRSKAESWEEHSRLKPRPP
jgi:hypothetical protein